MIRHFCKLLYLAIVLAVTGQINISQAAPVSYSCGAVVKSRVKTEMAAFSTNSSFFVNVPGAYASVVVPAGKTYCVKIRFSAVMRCTQTGAADACLIRATVGDGLADPAFNGTTFSGEDASPSVRSFQWIKERGAGTHLVRVEAAVQNFGTPFDIQGWTLDVELSE